jgi:hypothetical protein
MLFARNNKTLRLSRSALVLALLGAPWSLAQNPPPQPLDLNGVWTVKGASVGIKHSTANVTANFITSPGCSITQFFSASLSGAAPGSQMTGTINVCRDQPPPACPTPLSQTISAKMQATAQQNTINIDYEPENVVIRSNRFTHKITSCTTSPAGSMSSHFVLTRCAPGSSDCACRQASIDILKRIRDGTVVIKQDYENARNSGAGPTFQDVNAQVDAQAKGQGGDAGFAQTGSPELEYHGCSEDAPRSLCTSMEAVPNCTPSPSGIQSLDDMCVQHERGHGVDLQRAFQQLKRGEWTDKRFNDYVEGKSPRAEDTKRMVEDEIARYGDDIKFLDNAIAKLEQQRKQNCP